ncbi:hypothetical protein L7F22_023647 [Adiantum nelumboides]|nr:hypothetical protein [Adiantum nelumboides]
MQAMGQNLVEDIIMKVGRMVGKNMETPHCLELRSESGYITTGKSTRGGGVIVIGYLEHTLSSLKILRAVTSDGETFHSNNQSAGVRGGSGGILPFLLQTLTLSNSFVLSTFGGKGSASGGGGGAGGRIHFVGDDYIPIANVKGLIYQVEDLETMMQWSVEMEL